MSTARLTRKEQGFEAIFFTFRKRLATVILISPNEVSQYYP